MPIHDWRRVDPGIFHDFRLSWIAEIKRSLNCGLLPSGYYALAEQLTGNMGPDVLTLRRPGFGSNSVAPAEPQPSDGAIALADAPPRVRFHARIEMDPYASKAKTIVIRHRSRHQMIAMVEIVSPGNKSGQADFRAFVGKAERALYSGIHPLIIDVFPPTAFDPEGIHRAIWGVEKPGDFALPEDKPLTCVSYLGIPCMDVYLTPSRWMTCCRRCPCSSRHSSTCPSRSRSPTARPGTLCQPSGETSSPHRPRRAARDPGAAGRRRNDARQADRVI